MNIPDWQEQIQREYKGQISNAFMLVGNIGDYCYETTYLRDYLVEFLLSRQRVGHFNIDDVYFFDINNHGSSVRSKKTGLQINDIFSIMNNPEGRNAFIFYYPEFLIPAGDYISEENKAVITGMHSIINSSSFVCSANIAIFITETTTSIHPMFLGNNSRISLINIELPNYEQRYEFLKCWKQNHEEELVKTDYTIDFRTIAKLTAGLQLIAVEDIMLNAIYWGKLNAEMILDKKK